MFIYFNFVHLLNECDYFLYTISFSSNMINIIKAKDVNINESFHATIIIIVLIINNNNKYYIY